MTPKHSSPWAASPPVATERGEVQLTVRGALLPGGDAANCRQCRGRAVVLLRTGGGTVVLVRIVSAAADSGAAKGCSTHDGCGHANAAAGSWQQRPRSA